MREGVINLFLLGFILFLISYISELKDMVERVDNLYMKSNKNK